MDPTARFSNRAEDYARARPSYPRAVIELLQRECGLTPQAIVADIGCGTGLLAQLFCDFGCDVIGVEPNAEMRDAARAFLSSCPKFRIADGRAEATALPDRSVDFLISGQAAHWFEPRPTRAEFRRVLRPDGWLVLVWNDRRYGPAPFMVAYEELTQRFAKEYAHVKALWDHSRLADLFGNKSYSEAAFKNEQRLDCEGLIRRMLSASYMPARDDASFPAMMHAIRKLFEEHEERGIVRVEYDTRVFFGKPAADSC